MSCASVHQRSAIAAAFLAIALVTFAVTPALATTTPISLPQTGAPAQQVRDLWQQTRAHIEADLQRVMDDSEWVRHGEPLLGAWESLEKRLGTAPAAAPIHSVTKLIGDLYGRPYATPERRMSVRSQSLTLLGERIAQIEARLREEI
jgi:hypothetical protein